MLVSRLLSVSTELCAKLELLCWQVWSGKKGQACGTGTACDECTSQAACFLFVREGVDVCTLIPSRCNSTLDRLHRWDLFLWNSSMHVSVWRWNYTLQMDVCKLDVNYTLQMDVWLWNYTLQMGVWLWNYTLQVRVCKIPLCLWAFDCTCYGWASDFDFEVKP